MKLSWSFLFSSLLACSAASPKAGLVYVYDPDTPATSQQSPSVSPETARLILAQRLGLSQFHSIKDASDELIGQLNAFGGRQQRPFGVDNIRNKAQALIWIEDVDDASTIVKDQAQYSAAFYVADPPSSSVNENLIKNMILQAESLAQKSDPQALSYNAGLVVDNLLGRFSHVETYNDYLSVFRADKTVPLPDLSNSLAQLIASSKDLGSEGFAITVVFMPPSSHHSKRALNAYGTYDLPSTLAARRENVEALLSESTAQPSPAPQNFTPLTSEKFAALQSDDPVLGILPTCFDSQEACQKQTHSCSGHGDCALLRKGQKGSDATVTDCYGCKCNATVIEVGNGGKKTTVWGGPACQKKDVSVPFFLLLGSGVGITFLITFGIGMLYSIGNEELPSVIGAGVSGPVRK
ncbi:hypothetical protein BCR34DRAFT_585369 [Clohesyomyces aquaticus]|uniref:Uncharacterized protein n=1 Tax=Clohesyomyces aquaticus TaxID=1231657 RepID=A0A1Y1ZXQ4_9PLEO|nr:hypothetical protein BCR34DRAFT_585369 [Clohesyomyces aquaticus]